MNDVQTTSISDRINSWSLRRSRGLRRTMTVIAVVTMFLLAVIAIGGGSHLPDWWLAFACVMTPLMMALLGLGTCNFNLTEKHMDERQQSVMTTAYRQGYRIMPFLLFGIVGLALDAGGQADHGPMFAWWFPLCAVVYTFPFAAAGWNERGDEADAH